MGASFLTKTYEFILGTISLWKITHSFFFAIHVLAAYSIHLKKIINVMIQGHIKSWVII